MADGPPDRPGAGRRATMAVRKICKPKGCRGSPRCDHPWWFDVMCQGKRWRMRVDDFASLRGAKEPVTSKQAAERVWEPKFVGEIMAGAAFLDRYFKEYVEGEGLRDAVTIRSQRSAVKTVLGNQAVA